MMVFNWVFDIWSDFEDWILLKYVNDRAFLNLKYPFCYCYKISLDKQYFQETSKFWRIIKFSVHFCQHCKFWCLTMHCHTQKIFWQIWTCSLDWTSEECSFYFPPPFRPCPHAPPLMISAWCAWLRVRDTFQKFR